MPTLESTPPQGTLGRLMSLLGGVGNPWGLIVATVIVVVVLARMGQVTALAGRDRLREALTRLGFPLR